MTNPTLLENLHRASFVAEAKRAARLGLTPGEYSGMRRRAVGQWTEIIRALMVESNVTDPLQVLPDICSSLVEEAVAQARIAAKESAKREIQRRWLKASQP
jgi:hypothetical protein